MNGKFKKNYILSSLNQIIAIIVPLITTPYVSRVLQPEGIGIYSFTYAIVRYFWLFSVLGISILGTKRIGIFQDNREKRTEVFWNLFSLKTVLSFIFIVIYYLYVILFSRNKVISLIQGIYLFSVLFDITWFFQGLEEYTKITVRNVLIRILNVLFIFLFVKSSDDLIIYIAGLSIFSLVGNLSIWIVARKYIDNFELKYFKPSIYLKESLILFVPSIAAQIFAIIDKSMIGAITGSMVESGCYEQAFKIVDMTLIFLTTIGSIMIPSISKKYHEKKFDEVKYSIVDSFNLIFVLSLPLFIGIYCISDVLVPVFFGDGYEGCINILKILSMLYIFIGISSITGTQCLISIGKYKTHTMFILIGGCINIITNFILIPKIGALGAAFGSVCGEIFISTCELFYLQKIRLINLLMVLKNNIKVFVLNGLFFVLVLLFKNYLPSNIIGLGAIIFLSMITYLLLLILFRVNIIKKVLNFRKKEK